MDFDPEPIFAGVRCPTLLFYGADDEWLPVEASRAVWERAAARAGNHDLTVVRLPGTRHYPTLGDRRDIAATSPRYTERLLDWLTRWLSRCAPSEVSPG